MPLHKENKWLHFPPAIEEHAAEFAACYGYSHQAVSREAGIHSVFSTKKTNSLRVSPPHLWLTHVAPTTTATTTQLRRRPALSSSNTTSRSARRSQWGTNLHLQPLWGSPSRNRWMQPLHRLRNSSHPLGPLRKFRPPERPQENHIASAWSSSYKFLRESWGRRTAGHHVRLLFVLAQPGAQANKA